VAAGGWGNRIGSFSYCSLNTTIYGSKSKPKSKTPFYLVHPNMKVFGASTSTEVDVLGKAGEYIGVGGPAKGRSLADFGQKLSALKDAAKQVGTTAKYYLELGTSQAAIDLAKKILGDNNVVIFKVVKIN